MAVPPLPYALMPPMLYFVGAVLEGQFITPIFLGRRLELNAVAILLFVAMWAWVWGIVGAIIAVPSLVLIKVFCDHFEGLAGIGEFLSGPSKPDATTVEASETIGQATDQTQRTHKPTLRIQALGKNSDR
jgi:hypothetical protein